MIKNSEHPLTFTMGHVRSHTKFRPDRFSRFDVFWIRTDKHTPKQTRKLYIYYC